MIDTLLHIAKIAAIVGGPGLAVAGICYATSRIEEDDALAHYRLRQRLFPSEWLTGVDGGSAAVEPDGVIVIAVPTTAAGYSALRVVKAHVPGAGA